MFFDSWNKYKKKQKLSPLEKEIVLVILDHPEYHQAMENKNKFQQQSYYPELGETNPFLHMGLHLAIREQIATDRPAGIREIHSNLIKKFSNPLATEHMIMDQLAECLWLSQKNKLPPDESHYLRSLSDLIL